MLSDAIFDRVEGFKEKGTIDVEQEPAPGRFDWVLASSAKMRQKLVNEYRFSPRLSGRLQVVPPDTLYRLNLILELRIAAEKLTPDLIAERMFLLAGPPPSSPSAKDQLARLRGALTPTPPRQGEAETASSAPKVQNTGSLMVQ